MSEASDAQKARIQNTDRGLQSVRISQNAPDSAERILNSECKELFVIAQLTFQDTNVLLNPDNRRYTFADLIIATIANWDIVIARTAAIRKQEFLGFARVSKMMEQFRKTIKEWISARNMAVKQKQKEGGLGIGQGRGGYSKELAKQHTARSNQSCMFPYR